MRTLVASDEQRSSEENPRQAEIIDAFHFEIQIALFVSRLFASTQTCMKQANARQDDESRVIGGNPNPPY